MRILKSEEELVQLYGITASRVNFEIIHNYLKGDLTPYDRLANAVISFCDWGRLPRGVQYWQLVYDYCLKMSRNGRPNAQEIEAVALFRSTFLINFTDEQAAVPRDAAGDTEDDE